MAKYKFNGQSYSFPETVSDEQAAELMRQDQGSASSAPAPPTNRKTPGKIDPSELIHDPDWVAGSRSMYRRFNQPDDKKSDKEVSDWMFEQQSLLSYNTGSMALAAHQAQGLSPEEKKSMLYTMDAFDRTNLTWGKGINNAGAMIGDPLNLLGVGKLAAWGAKQLGKEALVKTTLGKFASREALKLFLRRGTATAVELGIASGANNVVGQQLDINLGAKDSIDVGEAAVATGVGALLGKTLGGAGAVIESRLAGRRASQAAQEAAVGASRSSPATTLPDGVERAPVASQQGDLFDGVSPTPKDTINVNTAGEARTNAQWDAASPAGADPQMRLFPDEVAPTVPPQDIPGIPPLTSARNAADEIITAVKEVSAESGIRSLYTNNKQLGQAAAKAVGLIKDLGIKTADQVSEVLARHGFTPEQSQVLSSAVREANQQLTEARAGLLKQKLGAVDGEQVALIDQKLADLDELQEPLNALDMRQSSQTGNVLQERRGSFATGENRTAVTVNDVLRNDGIDPKLATAEQKDAAEATWLKQYEAWERGAAQDTEMQAINKRIAEAVAKGDDGLDELLTLTKEREALQKVITDEAAEAAGTKPGVVRKAFDVFERVVSEYVISTVFAFSSLMNNGVGPLLKTLYLPALSAIVKGGDRRAVKEAATYYASMAQFTGSAFRSAMTAFKYEGDIMARGADKLLEGVDPIIPGKLGRTIRVFNRAMNASDAFFRRIHYQGFTASRAYVDAYDKALEMGLKGNAAETFAKTEMKRVVSEAYQKFSKPAVIDYLREQGVRRGLRGVQLDQYIKIELGKNPEFFQRAMDEQGIDYANDIMFTRMFTGKNMQSETAAHLEQALIRHPGLKVLTGQLFFRTPIRVFQEALRMTPVVNVAMAHTGLDPTFLKDLQGVNGPIKQTVANGSMMLSYGFAAAAFAMYSGVGGVSITGAGPLDYRENRNKQATGKFKPYTITFSDGTEFTYRNYEPFATPIKVLVNMMDGLTILQYRKAQGEFVDKEMEANGAALGYAVSALGQAIKDSGLTTGINQMFELGADMANPEKNMKAMTKWMGQKVQLAIPAVYAKGVSILETDMVDPATVGQYFLAKAHPGSAEVSRQYDPLGNVRTRENTIAAFFGVPLTLPGQKTKRPENTQYVLDELTKIETATNSYFVAPYKHKFYGDVDLRTTKTADGKNTLYDRWQQLYAESGVTDILYTQLKASEGQSLGAPGQPGIRSSIARDTVNTFRDIAFQRLLMEDAGVKQKYIENIMRKPDGITGNLEVSSQPYQ